MFVCFECCVLLGRGLCDALITRPEESYRLLCVVVCDLETSRMRRSWPALGRSTTGLKNLHLPPNLKRLRQNWSRHSEVAAFVNCISENESISKHWPGKRICLFDREEPWERFGCM